MYVAVVNDTSDYVLGVEEVGSLGWGEDEDIEHPTWEDVVAKLGELAEGEHDLVTLRLEPPLVSGERPPTLFAVPGDDEGLVVYFRSADHSLHTERESYSLDEVERIFQCFYEQLELDPREEWGDD